MRDPQVRWWERSSPVTGCPISILPAAAYDLVPTVPAPIDADTSLAVVFARGRRSKRIPRSGRFALWYCLLSWVLSDDIRNCNGNSSSIATAGASMSGLDCIDGGYCSLNILHIGGHYFLPLCRMADGLGRTNRVSGPPSADAPGVRCS